MHGRAWEKVPGGKLRIAVEHDGAFVHRVQLSGDFSIFPVESKSDIEQALVGLNIKSTEKIIAQKIDELCVQKKIVLLGANPQTLAKVFKRAIA